MVLESMRLGGERNHAASEELKVTLIAAMVAGSREKKLDRGGCSGADLIAISPKVVALQFMGLIKGKSVDSCCHL